MTQYTKKESADYTKNTAYKMGVALAAGWIEGMHKSVKGIILNAYGDEAKKEWFLETLDSIRAEKGEAESGKFRRYMASDIARFL